jgi:prepilin-type N-terminal cleavage/methylation domain-containing protein
MSRRRKAFTLVELLVVISIIGLLIALLLPAVQAARESARRCSCCNNLKQVGLAAQLHHNTYGRLPAGWDGYDAGGRPWAMGYPGWGWAARILPFLEQANVEKNLINFKLPVTDPANDLARVFSIGTFRCPSDTGEKSFLNADPHAPGGGPLPREFAAANYVGVWGTQDMHVCNSLGPGNPCRSDGSFFHNSDLRFADIVDGLSQTFLVGERSSRLDYSTWVGIQPGYEDSATRILGTASYPPNTSVSDAYNFSSLHPSGTHFLLADGSVRIIAETIDMAAYHALCTRSGSDSVGNFLGSH